MRQSAGIGRGYVPPTQQLDTASTLHQLDRVWERLADDPQRQALETARWCAILAPQHREWLQAKILGRLSDKDLEHLLFHQPEDGRIQALSLLASISSPPRPAAKPTVEFSQTPLPHSEQPAHPPRSVEGDPGLTRIANGLKRAATFRLWLVSHELNRAASGSGQMDKASLFEQLPVFGIQMTRRHYNALIRRENGRLWTLSRDQRVLHLRSYEKVAKRLTRLALEQNPDLVVTNPPGQKFKTICVAGSLADYEARCMAAWIESRIDTGMTNIAISTLAGLFGRSPNTIRDWLSRAGVAVQYHYTQYAGHDETVIPDHANLYVTKDGGYGVTWQLSNSYQPEPTPERLHQYTPRQVHYRCQQQVEEWFSGHPAGECGSARSKIAGGGVYRTGTLFFTGGDDLHKARKRVISHLKWHQDYRVAHHVFLGFKCSPYHTQEIGIHECVDPDQNWMTQLQERNYRAQYHLLHRQHQAGYREYLRE